MTFAMAETYAIGQDRKTGKSSRKRQVGLNRDPLGGAVLIAAKAPYKTSECQPIADATGGTRAPNVSGRQTLFTDPTAICVHARRGALLSTTQAIHGVWPVPVVALRRGDFDGTVEDRLSVQVVHLEAPCRGCCLR